MGRTLRSPCHLALMAALNQARLDAGLTQTELAERLKFDSMCGGRLTASHLRIS